MYNTKPPGETSGLFFGKAIDLAGLYIEIVMLTAIFSLAQSGDMGNKKLSAIPPEGAFMFILTAIVVEFHYFLNDSFKQLETALLLSLTIGATGELHSIAAGNGRTSAKTALNEKRALNGQGTSMVGKIPLTHSPGPENGSPQRERQEAASDEHDSPLYHSSLTGKQQPIWLPNDKFGLARAEVADARKVGHDDTCEHTSVAEEGQVETDAYEPPW